MHAIRAEAGMAQSADNPASDVSPLASRALRWALELVGVPSVTGTAEEAAFAVWLRERLSVLPIFTHDPTAVWLIPVPGDPLGRASVAALARGTGDRTIVLTGHFDTVHLEDYGTLAPLATDPYGLRHALLDSLDPHSATPAEALTHADLASGAFLPGRGLLDMKSGLAAGLAALEAFADDPERRGNLLFLAVPDEESNSAGARSVAVALPELARRLGLALEAAINLDALVDNGGGEAGRAVALGTIGKLLPSALVIGRPVHAANALDGVNAGMLAGAIAEAMEWAETLTDRTGAELGPPPTLLSLKDNRTAYDVTTPDRVWAYWNVMTHRRGPAEVMAEFGAICRESAAVVLGKLKGRAQTLGIETGFPAEIPVLTFEVLRSEVMTADAQAAERFAALAGELAGSGLDIPEQCRILTGRLWDESGRTGPGIVIGFASWPYLPTHLSGPAGDRLEAAARAAAADTSARHGCSLGVIRYFPGISDMSHLGQTDPAAIPAVAANTPVWGFGINWPEGTGAAGLPMINAGPWGRDYHTRLERLEMNYAFEVLPELLLGIINEVLREESAG
jgi:arginine utilization protein RocB